MNALRHFLALFTVAATCFTVAPTRAQLIDNLPSYGPTLEEVGIAGALDLVRTGDLPTQTARRAMLAAAESEDPGFTPVLKAIVTAYADEPDAFGLLALHALWELGEPADYFFDLADAPDTVEDLAWDAIWVAARAPTPEGLARAETAAADQTGLVADAVDVYAYVLSMEHSSVTTLQEEVDLLLLEMDRVLTWILSMEEELVVADGYHRGDLHPGAVWARRKLRELATVQPDSVSVYISEFASSSYFTEKYGPVEGSWVANWFKAYSEAVAFPEEERRPQMNGRSRH